MHALLVLPLLTYPGPAGVGHRAVKKRMRNLSLMQNEREGVKENRKRMT